jgi:hypothetical protein
MEKKNCIVRHFWQITSAHTISYFIAGVIAMTLFFFFLWWATEAFQAFYRDIDLPIIALGGGVLQIIRGIIVALILLPLRKIFFEEKYGLLKLALIIFGFSIVSTYGAVISSFEGLIYLKVPLVYHLKGIPEGIIWLSLFIGLLFIFKKYSHKKIVTVLSIIFVVLIVIMTLVGFFGAMGYISVKIS